GGDQAVVKTVNGYDFYGGISKGIEKHTRVKSRIIATALLELVETSENVIVMGHRASDLDCVGSAVALAQAIRRLGKPAIVAIDRKSSLASSLITKVSENGAENLFVHPDVAKDYVSRRTLLIIVDTHNPLFVESNELYKLCKNVVVIDHHRKMVNYIDNAVIFHHEPFASSTSEMVSELLQYFGDRCRPTREDAEALLSGIMLDTRNFAIRTGVRTFEAAAYLRRIGADTVAVRKLFSSTMDDYQRRSSLVQNAEIYRNCAIAVSSQNFEDIRIVAPQAADELLGINEVAASFVIYNTGGGISLSARSMGELNVQVVMEYLGGGGHHTMAGAQLKDVTAEEAKEKLLAAIDHYYETLASREQ
ncbi:MAG: DHH family phosphoesterase, partial [Oscillospiraceae bacterium]|nr:DHH family phosphoesterase [Oscillospiraceae bacterium]